MSRKARQLPEGVHEQFVSSRCSNKEWFRIPLPELWEVFSNHLYFCHHAFGIRIRAFVLMANHYHLFLQADSEVLPTMMGHLQREVAREINRFSGRSNQVWGSRYHSSVVCNHFHFLNVYKYLYRNPVEAGACKNVLDYQFSTLRGLIGLERAIIPVYDTVLFSDIDLRLKWLETRSLNKRQRDQIRRGLKYAHFKLPKKRDGSGNPLDFEAP